MRIRGLLAPEKGVENYGVPMILLLVSMVVVMSGGDHPIPVALALNLQGLALIATFRAVQIHPLARMPVAGLVLLAMLIAWFQAIFSDRIDPSVVPGMAVVLVLVATPLIVFGLIRQTARVGSFTVHSVMGTICIYLLISLGFASAFAVIGMWSGEPFFTQGIEWNSLRNCLYYSLTTITTVGIGDLAPATDLGRSLTATEALIGQIYIVTVVALVVGNVRRRGVSGRGDH